MKKHIETSFVPFVPGYACGFPSSPRLRRGYAGQAAAAGLFVAISSLVLATAVVTTTAAQSTRSADAIRIASWNIGDISDGSGEDARIMSEHLKLLRIDILALNHIDGDAERRNQHLEAIFARANERDGNDWEYVLFANRIRTDRSSLVGIAWNTDRVTVESDPFRAAVDEGQRWQKPPNAAKFSAGPGLTDVVVMPVQLDPKSPEAGCLAGTRGEEAGDLASHIQAAKRYLSDDDIVVIGDTDCIRDDPGQRQEFSTERVLELDTGDVAGFAAGRTSYSQVMVPLNQPEFERAGGYALLEAESQKAERPFSDHFQLLGPILVGADDD